MFRWHLVKKNNEWPQNMTTCFCQLDSANFEFRLLEFMEGSFLDDHAHPYKVFRWCYVDDIVLALNDITWVFMQSEAVKKETDNGDK